MKPVRGIQCAFQGLAGSYLSALVEQWLLVAPLANPAMLEMFRDRDSPPLRNLVEWAGEFAGKYLTGATQVLAATGDERLRVHLAEFVAELVSLQADDGYLGPWPAGSRLRRNAPNSRDGKDLWDAWGHYHVMLGLMLWSDRSGDPRALEAAARIGDLLCRTFLGAKAPRLVDTGSTEMNLASAHGLCLLYERTRERRHLDLARQIVDEFAARDPEGRPLAGDWFELALTGVPFHRMPKPRWESLHPIQALAALDRITGEERFGRAFRRLWWSMLEGDRHNNGGFSSGEQATGDPFDPLPIETCCTVAWMTMTVDMLHMTGLAVAADELDLSFHNSVLGQHSPTGRWATYSTPMNGFRRASAHAIVFQARDGSPELNCCSVNSPRGFGLLSEWALTEEGGTLVLNHLGPAVYTVPLTSGGALRLDVQTAYPLDGAVVVRVGSDAPTEAELRFRIPAWSRRTTMRVNDGPAARPAPGAYAVTKRSWRKGDTVRLDLDFSFHLWKGEGRYDGCASLYRGPLLLAFDHRYNLGLSSGDFRKVRDPADWKMLNDLGLSIPVLDARALAAAPASWTAWLPPHLLLELRAADGRAVRLCDFASAGRAGTPYASWLPMANVPEPSAFSADNPLRSVQPLA